MNLCNFNIFAPYFSWSVLLRCCKIVILYVFIFPSLPLYLFFLFPCFFHIVMSCFMFFSLSLWRSVVLSRHLSLILCHFNIFAPFFSWSVLLCCCKIVILYLLIYFPSLPLYLFFLFPCFSILSCHSFFE